MHPVFPGCGVIKKGPGGVSCPVLISKYTIMNYFTFEIFMKSSKLSCTLSLKSKERTKGYGFDFENN